MIEIGTQGWNYDGWVGSFYPPKTRSDELLSLYARIFNTVEIDSTFYAPPSESAVRGWARRTPDTFTFALKLPRRITHENRLRDSDDDLALFCERVRLLGKKLVAVLIQLPPDFSPTEMRALEAFLSLLPADVPFAIEFRDPAWMGGGTLDVLKAHRVALVLADSPWIPRELSIDLAAEPTADFSYVRWLGPRVLTQFTHIQIDHEEELGAWAAALRGVDKRVDRVVGYFNNHYEGHSPASANRLKQMLGQPPIDPGILVVQPSLF